MVDNESAHLPVPAPSRVTSGNQPHQKLAENQAGWLFPLLANLSKHVVIRVSGDQVGDQVDFENLVTRNLPGLTQRFSVVLWGDPAEEDREGYEGVEIKDKQKANV